MCPIYSSDKNFWDAAWWWLCNTPSEVCSPSENRADESSNEKANSGFISLSSHLHYSRLQLGWGGGFTANSCAFKFTISSHGNVTNQGSPIYSRPTLVYFQFKEYCLLSLYCHHAIQSVMTLKCQITRPISRLHFIMLLRCLSCGGLPVIAVRMVAVTVTTGILIVKDTCQNTCILFWINQTHAGGNFFLMREDIFKS